eukprot:13634-Heterococcus_DN1.PRE.2
MHRVSALHSARVQLLIYRSSTHLQTTVDWDAELKKLNSKKVKGVSEAEVSMLKLKRKVDNTINKTLPIKVNVPSAGSIGRDLKSKDWRFWALILAGIGFAAALSGALSREELVVMDDAALSSHLNGLLAYGDSSAVGSGNSALTGSVLAGQQVHSKSVAVAAVAVLQADTGSCWQCQCTSLTRATSCAVIAACSRTHASAHGSCSALAITHPNSTQQPQSITDERKHSTVAAPQLLFQ